MKTTKVLSIVLAVLLVFSFAACSSLPAEPTKPDTQTEAPATTETPADKPVEEPIETLADEPVEEPSETPEEPVEIVRNTIKLPGVPDAVSAVPDVVLPLTNEEVSFEFWLISQALLVRYGHTDADEWKVIREMKNRTGINVEFTIPSDYSTQFGIMMASGDMPDLIEQFKVYYRYGMDHAIDEELILPLEEYREYLPHLFAIIDSSDLIHNQCYTDAGHMPGIPFMKVDHEGKNEGSWAGFVVRQDWLDELNMEVPTTYSELDVVLSAIQENYPTAEHPLMIQCRGGNFVYDAGAVFHAGYNITGDWIQEDGNVVYCPLTDRYKDFVTMMTEWFDKGYLSADHITDGGVYMDPGESTLDEVGVFPIVYFDDEALYEANSDRPEYKLSPIPVLKIDQSTEIHVGHVTDFAIVDTAITTDCENPELLCQYWDYLFSNEGILLSNFGIEGETFEYDEDGIPQWIPEAFSSDDLAWTLQRFQGINLLYNTPGYTMFSREYVMCADSSLEIYRVWNEGWDDTWNYPVSATMTAEESEAYGAVMNDITTYVNETLGKIILGEASLDNWDSFIQSLYDMGIEDCIEYKQNALDRYNAR